MTYLHNEVITHHNRVMDAMLRHGVDLERLSSEVGLYDVNVGLDHLIPDEGNRVLFWPHQIKAFSGCNDGDWELCAKYADIFAVPREGCYTGFMGVRTSPAPLSYLSERSGTINKSLPFPDDAMHANAVEFCSLFQAVENSEGTFTLFELGAGWGPWMSYAVKACEMKGSFSRVNVVGVEGEENKIPLIKEHLTLNDIRADSDALVQEYNGVYSKIIHGIVDIQDGVMDFPVAAIDQYDASVLDIAFTENAQKIRVPAYSMETLLEGFDIVDIIHFDIQGHEYSVIQSAIMLLNQKARYLFIATHSRKIEGDLVELLLENDWEMLREVPCLFSKGLKPKNTIDLTTMDGAQFWKNTKIS